MNPNDSAVKYGSGKALSFHCADVMPNCDWQVSGDSEQEIMLTIEQHGHEKHNLTNLDDDTRKRLRNAIRRPAPEKIPA